MKLYKYMSPEIGKLFLASPFLRITPNSCLNDPFEIRLSASTKERIDLLDRASPSSNHLSTSMKFEEFMRCHGVISFSETPDNLLLWSHYAKDHKGISVEFNIDLQAPFSLFNTLYLHTASYMRFGKVNYKKKENILQHLTNQTFRQSQSITT